MTGRPDRTPQRPAEAINAPHPRRPWTPQDGLHAVAGTVLRGPELIGWRP